mmetsp:Transcript_65216/g.74957  ORF Transcript_65216/g.74957 Transcript_65216/m.74957 type:complete len:193 (+) Transcript_65216:485-1063(+)
MEKYVHHEVIERDFVERIDKSDDRRKFKCKVCSRMFTRLYSLKLHILNHLNIKRFECEICAKRFNSKHYLMDHLNIHTGNMPYKCNVPGCVQTFRQRAKLSRHKRLNHGLEGIKSSLASDVSSSKVYKMNTLPNAHCDLVHNILKDFQLPVFVKSGQLTAPKNLADLSSMAIATSASAITVYESCSHNQLLR